MLVLALSEPLGMNATCQDNNRPIVTTVIFVFGCLSTPIRASVHGKNLLLRGKPGYRDHPGFLMDSNLIGFHFLGGRACFKLKLCL